MKDFRRMYLGLTLSVIVSMVLYLFFLVTPKLMITTDVNNFDNLPKISWWQMQSGQVERGLRRLYAQGKLGSNFVDLVPFPKFNRHLSTALEKYGYDYLQINSEDVNTIMRSDGYNWPYTYPAFFQTELGDVKYLVIVQLWKNSDGTASFVLGIMPTSMAYKDDIPTRYLRETIDPMGKYLVTPILWVKDYDSCMGLQWGESKICSYMVRGQWVRGIIADKWIKKGVISSWLGRYPMQIIGTALPKYDGI